MLVLLFAFIIPAILQNVRAAVKVLRPWHEEPGESSNSV